MIGRQADALPGLTPDEVARYGRHLALPQLGSEGQRRLKDARALVVGAGGLGSPVALYLAAAGVGTLGVADFDVVDASNLQRQLLHGTKDLGRKKVESARDRLRDVNPHVEVIAHDLALDAGNAAALVRGYDLVVDATDRFDARYALSDACVALAKPEVYGSVFRFEGQVTVFGTPGGPCLRCLHREPPPPELIRPGSETGILGVVPGLVGLVQATEAVKIIVGIGEPLVGRLLLVDALTMEFRSVRLARDPHCPACGAPAAAERP